MADVLPPDDVLPRQVKGSQWANMVVEPLVVERWGGARAGIRTRVDGMKTRNDGPDYTTRATVRPPAPSS